MIKYKTTILFLFITISALYSSSWDEIDASLGNNKCITLKKKIKNRTFSIAEEYNSKNSLTALSTINQSIKDLDIYLKSGCLTSDNNQESYYQEFYYQETIYWETQKYKVKVMLGEKPERPTWSADEAIKIEQQRKEQISNSKNPLAEALKRSVDSTHSSTPVSSKKVKEKIINKLYGNEFNSFSPIQRKFIKKNLGLIHKITQRTLTKNGYPEISKKNKQQGTNIVSFYLHPNGNISELKLKSKIGYIVLDENTLKVVREAYKDYPLPRTKTKIVFYVEYTLY